MRKAPEIPVAGANANTGTTAAANEPHNTSIKISEMPENSNSKTNQTNADQTREILELRQKLNDTTQKNIAWQRYNEEREDYVSGLFRKNQQLNVENLQIKNEIAKISSHNNLANNSAKAKYEEERNHYETVISNLQEELENLDIQVNKYQQENQWFQANYDTSLDEIKILKKKLKSQKSELSKEKDAKILKEETTTALKERIRLLESNSVLLESQLEKAVKNNNYLENKA